MRLTASTVKSAEPREREYTAWDDDLKGFGLRVYPDGRRVFVVKYRIGKGRNAPQRKLTLGPPGSPYTAAEARDRARDMLAAARDGSDPGQELRPDAGEAMTVNALLDDWQREAAPFDRRNGRRRKEKSVAGDIARLDAHIRPLIGSKRVRELTPDILRKARADIAEGKTARVEKTKPRGVSRTRGGDGTAVQTLRIFSGVLAYAEDRTWISDNPARRVKLPASNARERYLSGAELERLGEALEKAEADGAHPHGTNIIRLLALTGARRGEIEALRWQDVDLERGFVLLPDTKTGRAAWPLSRPALELLEGLEREAGSEWVFPATRGKGHYKGLNKIWPEVRELAGLEGVRLHDLRHSFASIGASGGTGLPIVGKLLGHKQSATTQRYAHVADSPLRAAADKIGGTIAARLNRAKPKAVKNGT